MLNSYITYPEVCVDRENIIRARSLWEKLFH